MNKIAIDKICDKYKNKLKDKQIIDLFKAEIWQNALCENEQDEEALEKYVYEKIGVHIW